MLLAGSVWVNLEIGQSLTYRPEFLLDSMIVTAGPYVDRGQHEQHVLDTDGSVDWFSFEHIDELRFDRETGLLSSLVFHVPDQVVVDETCHERWQEAPRLNGTLAIREVRNFRLPATKYRWHDQSITALICLCSDDADLQVELTRLRVVDGLELLFGSGKLLGWMLASPARCLSDGSGSFPESVEDSCLTDSLGKYLLLVGHPRLDDLMDSDQEIRISLEEARKGVTDEGGDLKRRALLRDRIGELISEWYT